MINLLPVVSRTTSLLLAVMIIIDKFIPRVKLAIDDKIAYAGISVYLLLVLTELVLNIRSARVVKDTTRLSVKYLTKGRIFRKVILFVILGAMSVVTVIATNIPVVHALMISIMLTEVLTFIVRVAGNYYRVEITEDRISIFEDQRKVVHHSRIKDVEFRYEMFFLRMKDDGVYEVHVPSIRQEDQKRFVQTMLNWLEMHGIPVTREGVQNLQPFLQHGI